MWLKDSSIGRKLVMSITGLALVFFLLFHGAMNLALVFSEEAYNVICSILGANWYALIATAGLAFLVVLHFAYALYLTIQNRMARGKDRYAVMLRHSFAIYAITTPSRIKSVPRTISSLAQTSTTERVIPFLQIPFQPAVLSSAPLGLLSDL